MSSQVLNFLHRCWCGWRPSGHASILRFEPERIYLECRVCGWESPGIDVPETVRDFRRKLVA